MSSYRSAYENYYKNINNIVNGKKNSKRSFIFGKKADSSAKLRHENNFKEDITITDIIIKRISKELTGAIILILFFAALKYTPSARSNEMYNMCKQTLEQNFNYDESIDAFNSMQIGQMKGRDLKIGNFTAEDLKIENLRLRVFNFMKYFKGVNNL